MLLAKSVAFISAFTEYERLDLFCKRHVNLVFDIEHKSGWSVAQYDFHTWENKGINEDITLFGRLVPNKDYTDYIFEGKWGRVQWCLSKRRDISGNDPSWLECPGTYLLCSPKEIDIDIGGNLFNHLHHFI